MDYRSDKDKNYFSSDLSKWINENCTKEMTSINLDIFQLKKSLKRCRVIESKHDNEGMKNGQESALGFLSNVFSMLTIPGGWEIGVYVITGNYPYNNAVIKRLSDKKTVTVNSEQLRKFLNFEIVEIEGINVSP